MEIPPSGISGLTEPMWCDSGVLGTGEAIPTGVMVLFRVYSQWALGYSWDDYPHLVYGSWARPTGLYYFGTLCSPLVSVSPVCNSISYQQLWTKATRASRWYCYRLTRPCFIIRVNGLSSMLPVWWVFWPTEYIHFSGHFDSFFHHLPWQCFQSYLTSMWAIFLSIREATLQCITAISWAPCQSENPVPWENALV